MAPDGEETFRTKGQAMPLTPGTLPAGETLTGSRRIKLLGKKLSAVDQLQWIQLKELPEKAEGEGG